MVKGSNVGLSALSDSVDSVLVSLGWASSSGEGDADVSVLLLDAHGKVRSDADFYFYNNPVAADGSVQLLGKKPAEEGSEDRIGFDLTAIPSDVERIVVAASRYEGARFGELEDLRVTLADGAGEDLLRFSIADAGEVSAFIFGELYRREAEWKFRAVGQGYATGLAGLATDFGVDIDDDAAEQEASADDALAEGTSSEETTDTALGAVTAVERKAEAVLDAVPAPRRSDDGPEARDEAEARRKKTSARPRTAKKKVTLPKVVKKTLAENESWKEARLFPVSVLKSDRDREMRATSVLLSVMAQVPEFGRRLTAAFGAPAAYMDIAARRGYEAVITLSNDVALEGSPLVDVKIDGRRKHKVALWHLSWAEVAHQAQLLIRHEGVGNSTHAWLLHELLHYLQHENSGCHGFQNMGAAWVPVRKGIDDETLCQG
ncbi:TerD family protein, partial [Streptomyces sp. NPDC058855]|uniref:TerD family protein n=1 Tax=Streptomyces sp. NPDC058855 TaxID=3346651 RepID=UPI00367CF6F4